MKITELNRYTWILLNYSHVQCMILGFHHSVLFLHLVKGILHQNFSLAKCLYTIYTIDVTNTFVHSLEFQLPAKMFQSSFCKIFERMECHWICTVQIKYTMRMAESAAETVNQKTFKKIKMK